MSYFCNILFSLLYQHGLNFQHVHQHLNVHCSMANQMPLTFGVRVLESNGVAMYTIVHTCTCRTSRASHNSDEMSFTAVKP